MKIYKVRNNQLFGVNGRVNNELTIIQDALINEFNLQILFLEGLHKCDGIASVKLTDFYWFFKNSLMEEA